MITTFPTICPILDRIILRSLPRNPLIITAVSEMLLACGRDTLKAFDVDCPLTEAARKVLFQLPNLSLLRTAFEGPTLLPPVILPGLTEMHIEYPDDHEWLQGLYGAVFDDLEIMIFHITSPQVGNVLEAFQGVGLATSLSTTLSAFKIYSSYSWNPSYSPLLTFKQLSELEIGNPCRASCSSTVDDDTITNLARAMPRLEVLRLGSEPCGTPTGVTVKGLVELSCHCINLSTLRVHIRVDSLVQAAVGEVATSLSGHEPTVARGEHSLTLEAGKTPVTQETALTVALALLNIFPRIGNIKYINPRWRDVDNTVRLFQRLSNRIGGFARSSSKARP